VGRTLADVAAYLQIPVASHHADLIVESVGIDSRSLTPRSLWIAYPGAMTHAASHDAPNAVAAVTDEEGARLLEQRGIPVLVVDDPRHMAGQLAAWFLGHPASSLTMVGVTGTNGKTTVTHLVESALALAGLRTGIIGTLGARIGSLAVPLSRTTPEAPDLQHLLARMRDEDVEVVAMEVSSHALVLGRVEGITFDVSVFTNLSRDHLDFHVDMNDYFQAKSLLFDSERCRCAVICIDDVWGRRLAEVVTASSIPVLTYGLHVDADLQIGVDEANGHEMTVTITHAGRTHRASTELLGEFNAVNLGGALATLLSLGHDLENALSWLTVVPAVPGRMERVGHAPAVIVDYAHTPDAVETVLNSVGVVGSRTITVLGCGGDRDVEKRPMMGAVAGKLSDVLVITDDNPRSEDPEVIRAAVAAGAAGSRATVLEIADRTDAIRRALDMAGHEDVVLILGKGAEQGQEVRGSTRPFDDRDVARRLLQERNRP
jgi:UDP-N-acetylmuramoyl-L-alanyl-D-glutamate--2,6-diaminopimelate ligase